MNPLAIRIAADLKAFKANMQEMKLQLETNQAAMKRMASAFDGSRIIGDANAMVKAIHDIGGASKLTDSEMRRVNSTVNEALAKYKALGRDAPAELVKLRDATAKVETPTSGLTGKITALGVAAGTFLGNMAWSAVNKLGSELGEFAQRGLQLNAVQSSFERLAGAAGLSAHGMLTAMKGASRGLVSEFDLMTAANKAMLLGLPVSVQTMGELTKAATTLGRAMGQNATKSVDDLITALGRSSPMILDNLGITVKVGEANDIYAAKLKTTADKLTDAEKKTAFYEEAMRKAKDRTEELGEQTETLGEIMTRQWTSIGDTVSKATSILDIGIGSVLSKDWSGFFKFMQDASKQGLGMALTMEVVQQKLKTAVIPLTETQQALVRLNQTMGDNRKTGAELAQTLGVNVQSVLAYVKTLETAKTGTVELTAEQKAAIKEAQRLAEAFQKQVDVLTGRGLTREVEELAKQVAAAGKQGGLSAFQYEALGKVLSDKVKQGAQLVDQELHRIWLSHERLNPSIKVTTEAYKILADFMKKPLKLGLPTPIDLLPKGSFDVHGLVKQIQDILAMAGKDPNIRTAAAPVVKTWKDGFISFMGQAATDISNSIVSAIQGGGNVILAAVASLAQTVGQHFSAQFANAVDKTGKPLFSKAMAGILGGLTTGIIGVGMSIINDILKPSFTAMEILARQFGKSVEVVTSQLKAMGETGAKAYRDIQEASFFSLEGIKQFNKGMKDARDMFGLLGQFQTKEELEKIAAQWKEVHEYMLSSGKYTAAQLAEAWKRYEEAQKAAIGEVEPEDKRPVGARGFPTKAQLQTAVKEAQEAYLYIRDSGLYTADVIEQAWQQWQDAMIASGDETAKRMKDLAAEITSLQKAVEMETPEYDADGVRIYGVEELRNIERLAALEKEKAALVIAAIENEKHAVEEAAKAADLTADKEFEAAKLRAINLDGYLHKLFSKGYEIPITFRLPGGLPSGGGLPNNGSPFGNGAPLPTLPARASAAPTHITVVSLLDGKEVARNQVKYIPKELDFIGARR